MKKNMLFTLALLISFSSLLSAQSVAFGPQLGFIKSSDSDNSVMMPGAALRVNFIGLSVEGSIYYKSEEYQSGAIKAKSYPIMLTGFVNVLPLIHGEVGVGWYNTKIDYSGSLSSLKAETSNSMGYHLGAGAELPLGSLILAGDIRYVFLSLSSATSFKSNFYVIMVGAFFKL